MSAEDSENWVLASEIPFDELKGHRLEECVYWLLDGLGAKNLEWRVGGAGGGAADGGRDIEATFFVPDSVGEMQENLWWIECKGRSGTLEKDTVVSACNNATAYPTITCMVIATNTQFSNPTRDWVKQWQASHPIPRVILWDKIDLERMLSKQPATVLRLFRGGLSLAGKLEALRERYFNLMEYSSVEHLKSIWNARATLEIGPMERIALVANEFAHGDINERPWCGGDEQRNAVGTLTMALFNLTFLYSKWMSSGVDQRVFTRSIAYMFAAALRHVESDEVMKIISVALAYDGEPMKPEARDYLLGPSLDHLHMELQLTCSAECPRFSREDSVHSWPSHDPVEDYWYRFHRHGANKKDREIPPRLERQNASCVVGFPMPPETGCRLYAPETRVEDLGEFLSTAAKVIRSRASKPRSGRV